MLILRKWTKEKEQKENKQGKIYDWKEKEGRNKLNYKTKREETGEEKQEKRKKKEKKLLTRKLFHIVQCFKSDNYFIIRVKNILQP